MAGDIMAGAVGATHCKCIEKGLSKCYCNVGVGRQKPQPSEAEVFDAGGGCMCVQKGLSKCYCRVGLHDALEGASPEEEVALRVARAAAMANRDRDGRVGAEALVNLWREVSKPRKGGAIEKQPDGCKVDCPALFDQMFALRGLSDALAYDRDEQGWAVYRYTRSPVVNSTPDWEVAFHGTWWYSVWSVLDTGILLESNNRNLGHDFWEPGVYCSPSLDTGLWYARPQILFEDGVYHRVMFELRVDPERRKKDRKRGGIQWVFPCAAVSLHGVWIRSNAPPKNGEERVNSWEPHLEALPIGCAEIAAVVNTRKGPWPYMVEPFPFDDGDNSAPPWMQTRKSSSSSFCSGVGTDGGSQSGIMSLGGLYGHWLKKARAEGKYHLWRGGASAAAPAPAAKLAAVAAPRVGALDGWGSGGVRPTPLAVRPTPLGAGRQQASRLPAANATSVTPRPLMPTRPKAAGVAPAPGAVRPLMFAGTVRPSSSPAWAHAGKGAGAWGAAGGGAWAADGVASGGWGAGGGGNCGCKGGCKGGCQGSGWPPAKRPQW
mmetsp:Transcript_9190/g.23599  ORF Transcript_9190/g.23599 Transcript_9190/m.23599 type:complete len:545 (-) Transcript_9190:124-1758(-)